MSPVQSFEIQGFQRWIMLASPWLMLAFSLLGISLPFLPDDSPRNDTFTWVLGTVTAIGFGIGAWYSFGIVRTLHLTSVSADAEGIWQTALSREMAMVRWADVVRLRERPRLQRLELLSDTGAILLKLEYQLSDFEKLRALVLERARLNAASIRSVDGTYSMPVWHHALSLGILLLFVCLGLYVGTFQPLLGYLGVGLVVALVGWEYFTSPYRIRTTPTGLEVHTPGRVRIIPRHAISNVALKDQFVNGMRHPYVVIEVQGKSRPVALKRFPQSAAELSQALQAWRAGDA